MTTLKDGQRWLNAAEVAELLGLSRPTAGRLIQSGQIPGFKVGRQWRVPVAAVRAFLRDATTDERAHRILREAVAEALDELGDDDNGAAVPLPPNAGGGAGGIMEQVATVTRNMSDRDRVRLALPLVRRWEQLINSMGLDYVPDDMRERIHGLMDDHGYSLSRALEVVVGEELAP